MPEHSNNETSITSNRTPNSKTFVEFSKETKAILLQALPSIYKDPTKLGRFNKFLKIVWDLQNHTTKEDLVLKIDKHWPETLSDTRSKGKINQSFPFKYILSGIDLNEHEAAAPRIVEAILKGLSLEVSKDDKNSLVTKMKKEIQAEKEQRKNKTLKQRQEEKKSTVTDTQNSNSTETEVTRHTEQAPEIRGKVLDLKMLNQGTTDPILSKDKRDQISAQLRAYELLSQHDSIKEQLRILRGELKSLEKTIKAHDPGAVHTDTTLAKLEAEAIRKTITDLEAVAKNNLSSADSIMKSNPVVPIPGSSIQGLRGMTHTSNALTPQAQQVKKRKDNDRSVSPDTRNVRRG